MIVKIWDVIEGPIAATDCPEEGPDGANWYMVCRAEVDGIIADDNFWFEDFDSAYEWKKYFLKNIEPLVVDMPDTPEYN